MRSDDQNKRSPDWLCGKLLYCIEREAVYCPTNVRYSYAWYVIHDAQMAHCNVLVHVSFILCLIYSHIQTLCADVLYSIQRMNETNVEKSEKKEESHFFPGGHIIADSEYLLYKRRTRRLLLSVYSFIQLASSPPRLHFAVAGGTWSWCDLYQSKL